MVHLMTFTHYNRSLKPTHEKRSSKSMNGILNIIEYWNIFYGIYFNWLDKIFQATYSIISYYFISLGKLFTFTICFSTHYRLLRIPFSRICTDWKPEKYLRDTWVCESIWCQVARSTGSAGNKLISAFAAYLANQFRYQ